MRYAITAAIAAFVLAACGGGGSDDDGASTISERAGESAPSPTTREEFIARADEICADRNEKIDPIEDELDELAYAPVSELIETADGARDLLRKADEAASESLRKRRDLTPPSGDENTLERYHSLVEDQIDLLPQVAGSLFDNDELERLDAKSDKLKAKIKDLSREYGFKVCGRER